MNEGFERFFVLAPLRRFIRIVQRPAILHEPFEGCGIDQQTACANRLELQEWTPAPGEDVGSCALADEGVLRSEQLDRRTVVVAI